MHVLCEDTTLVIRNLTIQPLARLTLRNVELVIDAGIDSDGGVTHWDDDISVLGNDGGAVPGYGGGLYVYGSTLRARDPDLRPGEINLHGASTLVLHDSEIRDFYIGIVAYPDVERLEVVRSTLSASLSGIYSFFADDVLVRDSLFVGPGEGIYVEGATGTIHNNTFTGCTAALFLRGTAASVRSFSHNTVTNCQVGLGADSCLDHVLEDNDVFRNTNDRGRGLPTWDSGTCGSVEGTWWGETGPDPRRMGRPADHAPWRTEPLHPERLPTAAIAFEGPVRAGEPVELSAAASRPSGTFQSPLAGFAWDLDGTVRHGQTVTHAFADPGLHRVSVLVTDALGISRMAFAEVRVEPPPPDPPEP